MRNRVKEALETAFPEAKFTEYHYGFWWDEDGAEVHIACGKIVDEDWYFIGNFNGAPVVHVALDPQNLVSGIIAAQKSLWSKLSAGTCAVYHLRSGAET